MLQIDYSLLKLSESDEARILKEIRERIDRGQLPAVERALSGRVVVVNPDPVQTVHQIPDELRPRLRRILMSSQEGSRHLKPEDLILPLQDTTEPLYTLILEVQSEFRSLVPFLELLPKVREAHPELVLLMLGTVPHLMACFQKILEDGRSTLVLHRPADARPVEIHDAKQLAKVVSIQDSSISFTLVFFSQIRLALDRSGKLNTFNVSSLRSLHPVFGHGAVVEMEIGRGKKEHMHVVDLPVGIIHDFQFRPDRSPDFYGVVMDGMEIPSRLFADERMEYRWIPLTKIEAYLRRLPNGEHEKINASQVRALRINCLTGQMHLVLEQTEERVGVSDIHSLTVKRRIPPPPKGPRRKPEDVMDKEVAVRFERVLLPQNIAGEDNPVHQAIRESFYGGRMREELEQAVKLEAYTRRMAVGAVGPLAGQTVKLFRRFGLEQLIDPDSFFYLCDSMEDMPHYHASAEKFQEHFKTLVDVLAGIVSPGTGGAGIKINEMAYHLPISTQWVDTDLARFEAVTEQELEACYLEMNVLTQYIAHEFQRNFSTDLQDIGFFGKIEECRSAGLLAKWLAEYKREGYGKPLPPRRYPDILFLGTREDSQANGTRYFFPAIACQEVFSNPASQKLYQGTDYEFSVFLEEQLAMAAYMAREEGLTRPGPEQLRGQVQRGFQYLEKQLGEMRGVLAALDDSESEAYKTLLKEEEQAYQRRYDVIIQDRVKVDSELKSLRQEYDEIVSVLLPLIQYAANPEKLLNLQGPEPTRAQEEELLRLVAREEEERVQILNTGLEKMIRAFDQLGEHLEAVPKALRAVLERHSQWRQGREALQGLKVASNWAVQVQQRKGTLLGLPKGELAAKKERLEVQGQNEDSELEQQARRQEEAHQKNLRVASSLLSMVRTTRSKLKLPQNLKSLENLEAEMAQVEMSFNSLKEVNRVAANVAGTAVTLLENREKERIRRERLLTQQEKTRLDRATLTVLAGEKLPPPPGYTGPAPDPKELQTLSETWMTMRDRIRQAPRLLERSVQTVEDAFRLVRGEAAAYRRLYEKRRDLAKNTSRIYRLRLSREALEERQAVMQNELEDLPQRVQEKFMPARKQLLTRVFLPDLKRREENMAKVEQLIGNFVELNIDRLRALYMDRAVHRRFHSRQFLCGWMIGHDPEAPNLHLLRNIQPAVTLLHQTFRRNFLTHHVDGAQYAEFSLLAPQKGREIMERIRNLAAQRNPRITYIVLPPTLSVGEALSIINQKDEIYGGVPQLVLIYISKFDGSLMRTDPHFRESYFKALKHNVVVNVDGHQVVDNPRSISARLLQETLGCAFDMKNLEALSDDESAISTGEV